MKKDLDTLSRDHQFHMNKAEDLTMEWFEYRQALTKFVKSADMGLSTTPREGEMSPIFYLEVASNGLREESTMLRKVRMHRRKAARLLTKIEKRTRKYPPEEYKDPRGPIAGPSYIDEAAEFLQSTNR